MQNVRVKDNQIILDHEAGHYPIDSNRCDNAEKLLGWIEHLCAKKAGLTEAISKD